MYFHPGWVFLTGLVVIILGAEALLRGASRVAARLGVKPMIIGLTVVSLGTSTPELAVGITAAIEDKGSLAIGNIAGTNILNILFILGLSALIRPLPTSLLSVKLDVPLMILSAVALWLMSYNGVLSRIEGVAFVICAILYTYVLIILSRGETPSRKAQFSNEFSQKQLDVDKSPLLTAWNVLVLIFGMATTVFGAELLVAGAVDIAKIYHVSDAMIGLTIVAIGTSAPELFTTILSTLKNDRDVAIGNLIGSSIYNILAILGITMIVAPNGIKVPNEILWIDLTIAMAVAMLCLPVFRSDQKITRVEGGIFVAGYFAYLTFLIVYRS